MREITLSRCEKNFINKSIAQKTRLDGRDLLEARPVTIHFGSNWGCCHVSLGQTKVVAQVSCTIQQPTASRPNEGLIHLNVELNPIAAPHFEAGRLSETGILINRQIEKCFKTSKCIDLESLCIVAAKKVWNLRVDINIINHDGNLVDCASIAALAALSHFHRPDVTSTGDGVVVHSFSEKDPLPLTLFHYPICVSFITFEDGSTVIDPTYLEERVGVAQLTLGINSYKELCNLEFEYFSKTTTVVDVISEVSNHAANYAAKLIQYIRDTVKEDVQARYKKEETKRHFRDCIAVDKITAMMRDRVSIKLANWDSVNMEDEGDVRIKEEVNEENEEESSQILKVGDGCAELIMDQGKLIGEGGPSTWQASSSSEDDDDDDEDDEDVKVVGTKPKHIVIDDIEISGDSEEETTTTITTEDIMN